MTKDKKEMDNDMEMEKKKNIYLLTYCYVDIGFHLMKCRRVGNSFVGK